MLVDKKSYALARHFLKGGKNDTEENRQELAEAIQQAVESWFGAEIYVLHAGIIQRQQKEIES